MTAPAVGPSRLLRDALVTIVTRFGLAILIFATDVVLARQLGPSAKGRFTLVLLYSQLVALVLGWGMDHALGVLAARSQGAARGAIANAIVWTAVVGGFGVIVSAWAYGLGPPGPPEGPLVAALPNLSARQFVYAAVAVPGELFFALGLFVLLGRSRVVEYAWIRLLRRGLLLVLMVATALVFRLDLNAVLILNLIALAATGLAILWVARRDDALGCRTRASSPRRSASAPGRCPAPSPSGSSFGPTPSSSTPSWACAGPGCTR
jgi:hypothetical protein